MFLEDHPRDYDSGTDFLFPANTTASSYSFLWHLVLPAHTTFNILSFILYIVIIRLSDLIVLKQCIKSKSDDDDQCSST